MVCHVEVSHERIGNLAGPVDVLIGEVGEGLVLGVLPPLVCEPTDGCLQLLYANTTAGYTSLTHAGFGQFPPTQSSTYTFS